MTKIIITFNNGVIVEASAISIKHSLVYYTEGEYTASVHPSYIQSVVISYHRFDEAGRD